jgi:nucleoside-diphosphate-sugar epimerase
MNVAVFGSSGFIGKYVAKQLRDSGHRCTQISRSAASETVVADITDPHSLLAIDGLFDIVVICAAALPKEKYQVEDVEVFMKSNGMGIINVLQWARTRGVTRVIYCSTLSIVPKSAGSEEELIDTGSHYIYKVSKAAGEHLLMGFCKENGLHYFALRLSAVYGPGMQHGLIQRIAEKVSRGEQFTVADNSILVDLVHVEDVAATILACVDEPQVNMIINVTSGRPIGLQPLAELINRLMNKPAIKILITKHGSVPYSRQSNATMVRLIGRPAITLEEGLKSLIGEQV